MDICRYKCKNRNSKHSTHADKFNWFWNVICMCDAVIEKNKWLKNWHMRQIFLISVEFVDKTEFSPAENHWSLLKNAVSFSLTIFQSKYVFSSQNVYIRIMNELFGMFRSEMLLFVDHYGKTIILNCMFHYFNGPT